MKAPAFRVGALIAAILFLVAVYFRVRISLSSPLFPVE